MVHQVYYKYIDKRFWNTSIKSRAHLEMSTEKKKRSFNKDLFDFFRIKKLQFDLEGWLVTVRLLIHERQLLRNS